MQNEREDVIIYSPKYLIERKKEKKYKKKIKGISFKI